MKKLFCLLLIAMALCSLAACGREKDKGAAAADSADNQAPESSVSQKQPAEKKSESKPAASEPTQSTDVVDVDLTRLSSTMVYSEVYNMMYTPGDYIGKTIKMTGQFVYYENPDRRSCPTPTQDSTASASTRSVRARASSPAGIVCADSQAPALPVSLFAVRTGSLYSPAADSPAASAGSRGTQAAQTDRNSQEQTRKHAPAQSAYEAAVPNAPHSNF